MSEKVPGEHAYDVIYRATADFSDLAKKAAEARAEIQALKTSADEFNKSQAVSDKQAQSAADAKINSYKGLSQAMKDLTASEMLLNKQENRGFNTAQEAYSFRDREIQQKLQWNKADNNGRLSKDEAIRDIRTETQAIQAKNEAVRSASKFFTDLAKAQSDVKSADPFAGSATRFDAYAASIGQAAKRVEEDLRSVDAATTQALNPKSSGGIPGFFSAFTKGSEEASRALKTLSETSALDEIRINREKNVALSSEEKLASSRELRAKMANNAAMLAEERLAAVKEIAIEEEKNKALEALSTKT